MQLKMETVHRTELEGAEVCSGSKFQRREAVLVWGGHAEEDYSFAEQAEQKTCSLEGLRGKCYIRVRENRDTNQAVSKAGRKGSSFSTLTGIDQTTARS